MNVMKPVSGVFMRCGVLLRIAAAIATMVVAVWAGWQTWSWSIGAAIALTIVYVVWSLAATDLVGLWSKKSLVCKIADPVPFTTWRALTLDGRVTAWKLLLWPLLIPAEGLVCLWLVVACLLLPFVWLARLLNADLSGHAC